MTPYCVFVCVCHLERLQGLFELLQLPLSNPSPPLNHPLRLLQLELTDGQTNSWTIRKTCIMIFTAFALIMLHVVKAMVTFCKIYHITQLLLQCFIFE